MAPNPDDARVASAHDLFQRTFGTRAAGVSIAPGRVNVIGEHTDYNDGFVFPIALDRAVAVAFAPRADRTINVRSSLAGEARTLNLDSLDATRTGWAAYISGVAWAMMAAGEAITGADMVIESDVPAGAGLSSSAALEVATYRALSQAAWTPATAATLCRRAENDFVGVSCGIMDQYAAAASRAGRAMLLDCRSLEAEFIPLPASGAFVVMDTGVRRSLSASEYNDRRRSCERVVATIKQAHPGVRALRDVTEAQLEAAVRQLDPVDAHRAWHVIGENERVLAAAKSLRLGKLSSVGAQMYVSHTSLRELYDVSSPELDALVDRAASHAACHGARMTGAGFGGCAIALVDRARVEEFVHDLAGAAYEMFVCAGGAGVRVHTG
jgi:galactokinase